MDKIIEALIKVIPFSPLFESIGLSKETGNSLAGIINILLIVSLGYFYKYCLNRYKNTKTAKELVHFRYSYKDVKRKRELFIATQAQNYSPTYEEEPKQGTKFIVRKPLIPFFIKTVFNEKKDSDKFYLILGDSGMGKTTFMINLYLKYTSVFNLRAKYKMKLFPFGDRDILKWIKGIEAGEARNTILLLDAFDEYKALRPPEKPDGLTDDERFRKILDEVIENVKGFREVVITSRTQYFPGQEKQPYELKIPRFGSPGFHTLAKLYLSPFDDKEINLYLNKKYGVLKFWNRTKKQIARTVVDSSPKLMVRPMLLSYIDLFVDESAKFENTYQVYDTLIIKWIEREADKRKHKLSDRKKFKQDLYKFSRLAALKIYANRKADDLLTKEEAYTICEVSNINLKEYEITGQSLLTRDASQNWKFAHKSILEFFLAREAIKDRVFARHVDWKAMDMARQFYYEIVFKDFVLVKSGSFKISNNDVKLSDYYISKYQLTQKEWHDIMGHNPSHFVGDNLPVEDVSWDEVQKFIKKLNEKTSRNYRLPFEAEWTFAACGGRKSKGYKYAGGNNLDKVGWYSNNSENKTWPVGGKTPNELGIYDMSGNIWEWTNSKEGSLWIFRGGSWGDNELFCRVSFHYDVIASYRDGILGFRLAHSLI